MQYRILDIMDTTMDATNQRVAVIELVEIKYEDFELPSGVKPYTFGTKGDRYVIDFNSYLTQQIIETAQNEEILELDLSEFKSKSEFRSGGLEKIYYHKSVKNV